MVKHEYILPIKITEAILTVQTVQTVLTVWTVLTA